MRREMWSGTLGRGSDGGEAGGDQVGGEDSQMETIKTEPEGSAHTGGTGRNPKDPKLRERGRGHAADAGYNFLSGSRSRRTLSKTCRNLYLSVQWTCSRLNTKEGGVLGFGLGKVLGNLYQVQLSFVLLLLFFVIGNKNRKRRAGGAALRAGTVSCDQPDAPDR